MWIVFAVLSAFFYACATMFSKFSISKVVRDQKGIVVIHAFAAMVAIFVLWLASGRPQLANVGDVALAMLGGSVISLAAILYFKAFHMEEASIVTLLSQAVVPFTMLAGVVLLHEKIGPLQLLASALILGGIVFATWSRKGFHLENTAVIPVLLIGTLLTTTIVMISKVVIGHNNAIAYTLYQTAGYAVSSLAITVLHRPTLRGFYKNIRPIHIHLLLVIFTAEILYTLAILCQLKGYSFVSAGLVISVGASEVFISIMLGMILTKFFPHIISEKVDRKTLGRKFIAGIFVVTGIVILNFVGK